MTQDPSELVELTSFQHEFTAQLLLNRLADEGIDAKCFSLAGEQLGLLSASTSAHGGAQVRVRASDLDRAQAILDEFNSEHAPEEDEEDSASSE